MKCKVFIESFYENNMKYLCFGFSGFHCGFMDKMSGSVYEDTETILLPQSQRFSPPTHA